MQRRKVLGFSLLLGALSAQAQYWAKDFGGAGADAMADMVLAPDGSIYITGEFTLGMDVQGTTYTSAGGPDVFVAKLDATDSVLWMRVGGGPDIDRGTTITLAPDGDVLVAGQFMSTADLFDSVVTSTGGTLDLFIARLDALTGELEWVRTASSTTGTDRPNAITVAPGGNVLTAGEFRGTIDFGGATLASMPDPYTLQPSIDAFVSCHSSTGALLWVQAGSGEYTDRAVDLVSDAAGNAFVCGQFSDTVTFDQVHPNTMYNATFVIKLDASGDEQWYRRCGGATFQHVRAMQLTTDDDLLLCGDLRGTMYFFDGSTDAIAGGAPYAYYLMRLSLTGDHISHETLGSQDPITARSVVQYADTVAVLGEFECQFGGLSDFYSGSGLFIATGDEDLFVARHHFGDLALFDAQQFGGQQAKRGAAIGTTTNGDLLFSGTYDHLLVLPSDSSLWGDTHTMLYDCSRLFNFNSWGQTWCGDPNYGQFSGLVSAGGRDGFIAKGYVRDRKPYDFWHRLDSADCSMGMYAPCIQGYSGNYQECPDTLVSCAGYQILRILSVETGSASPFSWSEEEPGCDSMAYTGPDVSILWSNGAQTRTTTIYSSGWVWCTVSTTNDCLSWTDSVFVSLYSVPVTPHISDGFGVNTDALYTTPIFSCDDAWIWCPNVPPGFICTWYVNGDTIPGDSVFADTSSTYSVTITNPDGCYSVNLVQVVHEDPVPMPNITDVQVSFMYGGVPLGTDTITVCEGSCIGGPATVSIYVDGVLDTLLTGQIYSYSSGCPGGYLGPFITAAEWSAQALVTGWLQVPMFINLASASCLGETFGYAVFDSVYVEVLTPPSVGLLGAGDLCPGDTLLLVATCPSCDSLAVDGWAIASWSEEHDSAWVIAGGYYTAEAFTILDSQVCSSGLYTVYVGDIQAPSLTLEPEIACTGDSALLFANYAYGTSFTWWGPDGDLGVDNDSVVVITPGDYYLVMVDYSGCSLTSADIELLNYATPSVEAWPDQILCAGESATLQVFSDAFATIAWQAPLSGGDPEQEVFLPGIYSCTVEACDSIFTLSITVLGGTASATVLEPGPIGICGTDSTTLHALPGQAGYEWLPGGEFALDLPVGSPGAYQLVAFDDLGCTDTSAVIIITQDSITVPLAVQGDSVCAGEDALLVTTGSGTISWYADAGALLPFWVGGQLPVPAASSSAIFFVVQQEGACVSDTLPAYLFVAPSPEGTTIVFPEPVCAGDTIEIALAGVPGVNADWLTPAGALSGPVVLLDPVDADDAGLYTATPFIGECVGDPLSIVLVVNEPGSFSLGADTLLCDGNAILLQVPAGFEDPTWSTGAGSYAITVNAAGTYSVSAIDANGCTVSDAITVDVEDCDIIIPNVLTPNGDGENDVLTIDGGGARVTLLIFNRWGAQMTDLSGEVVKWNGRNAVNNERVPDGVYFYTVTVERTFGEPLRKSGYVQVLH